MRKYLSALNATRPFMGLLLLPLVAALVGMAAFLTPSPDPAEAQADDWRSWNPTLTVKDNGGNTFGCTQAGTNACSTAISDDTFIVGGASLTLDLVSLGINTGSLILNFTQNIPNQLHGAYLQVGSNRYYMDKYSVISGTSITFDVTGTNLVWAEGDSVRFRLHPPTDISNYQGTLTARDLSSGEFGCSGANSNPQRHCGGTHGAITANLFNLDGASYYIEKLYIRTTGQNSNRIYVEFDREIPRALHEDYILTVDGHILAFQYPASTYTWGPWEPVGSKQTFPFRWKAGSNASRVKVKFVKKTPPAPVTGAATPLRILTASRTSVREGDGTVTITATLARNAEEVRNIPIVHDSNPRNRPVPHGLKLAKYATSCTPLSADRDYTLSPANITIPAGQRRGTATLTVCDDNTEDSGEFVYLTPDLKLNPIPEAYPRSGSGVYQVESLKITILNDETGPGGNGGTGQTPVEQRPTPTPQPQQQRAVPQPTPRPAEQPAQEPVQDPERLGSGSGGGGNGNGNGITTARYVSPDGALAFSQAAVAPGQTITVTGTGFTGWTPLQSVTIGGLQAFAGGWVITDPNGKFTVDVLVPGLSRGSQQVVATVGGWTASSYLVIDPNAVVDTDTPVARVATVLGSALDVMFYYDTPSDAWQFYDPTIPGIGDLTKLEDGEVYLVKVKRNVSVVLNGKVRKLTCYQGNCWNMVVW